MQQALRPYAAIMDPSLSMEYEVVKPYLLPHANLIQQPGFFARVLIAYIDMLPIYVI
jgi:hypothetical protein